jgi:hypothetical protein
MHDQSEKRERAVRRRAKRVGLLIEKSRVRTPTDPDYGTYRIADPSLDITAHHGEGSEFGLTLDAVETALAEEEAVLEEDQPSAGVNGSDSTDALLC